MSQFQGRRGSRASFSYSLVPSLFGHPVVGTLIVSESVTMLSLDILVVSSVEQETDLRSAEVAREEAGEGDIPSAFW